MHAAINKQFMFQNYLKEHGEATKETIWQALVDGGEFKTKIGTFYGDSGKVFISKP